MSRRRGKNDPNFLDKERVLDLLRMHDLLEKYSMNGKTPKKFMLAALMEENIITDAQLGASFDDRKFQPQKCGLTTIIKDATILSKIEEYVRLYSVLHYRLGVHTNLYGHTCLGIDWKPVASPGYPDHFVPIDSVDAGVRCLYEELLLDAQTVIMRALIMPERFDGVLMKGKELPIKVKNMLDAHSGSLAHLHRLTEDWRNLSKTVSWTLQTNQHIITQIRQAMEVDIRKKARSGAHSYLLGFCQRDDFDMGRKLKKLLFTPLPRTKPEGISDAMYHHIKHLRACLGAGNAEYVSDYPSMTVELFDLYIKLFSRGVIRGNLFPIGRLARKHAYIDAVILNWLMPDAFNAFVDHYESNKRHGLEPLKGNTRRSFYQPKFWTETGLDPAAVLKAFREKRAKMRALARKAEKEIKKNGFTNTKVDLKWLTKGIPKIPLDATISSIETDGISLVLYYRKREPLPNISEWSPPEHGPKENRRMTVMRAFQAEDSNLGFGTPNFVGIDFGRAKIFQACIRTMTNGAWNSTQYQRLTKKRYYHDGGMNSTRKLEMLQRSKSGMDHVLTALSDAMKLEGLSSFLVAQSKNVASLYQEFIANSERARRALSMYGLKRRCLDTSISDLVKAATPPEGDRRIIFSYGNAFISPTGKHESYGGVPTRSIVLTLKHALARTNQNASLMDVDEFRTTCRCSVCGDLNTSLFVNKPPRRPRRMCPVEIASGRVECDPQPRTNSKRPSGRKRVCQGCGRISDRDINASENIVQITYNMYYGTQRPSFLMRETNKRAKK